MVNLPKLGVAFLFKVYYYKTYEKQMYATDGQLLDR